MLAGGGDSGYAATWLLVLAVALGGVHAQDCSTGNSDCKNGGTCTSGSCSCAGGWTGPTCTTDPCTDYDCGQHGTCHGNKQCTCAGEWGGSTCTEQPCANNNNCGQHGTCEDSGNSHTCTCSPGWHGLTCDAQDACPDPPAGVVPHVDAGDCTSHTDNTCTYTCNEGYQCSPECTTLPCAANCVRTCNNGTAFTAPMTCSEKPCTGVDPPVIGAHMHLGDCTDPLVSGESCKPTCDEGYVLTAHGGHSSGSHAKFLCTKGAWNTLTCEPKGCTADEVIAAAAGARIWTPNTHGDPPFSCGALSGGQPAGVCTPTKVGQHSVCVPGYTPSTNPPLEISCSTGTVTVLGSCDPMPCTCGDNYPHGNRGDCHPNGNHMESGTLCTPNCTDGYMLATPKRCLRSACSGGTCIGKPCNATAIGVEQEVQPSKTFKQGARISEGSCTESLASGGTCQPNCTTGDGFVAHGVTTCSLGVITSISFCEAPKPTKALERMGFTQQTNTSGDKYWAAPDSAFRSGVVWLLYLCLVAIVMMGCCGTWKMASAKISKDEFESVTDWSRVE